MKTSYKLIFIFFLTFMLISCASTGEGEKFTSSEVDSYIDQPPPEWKRGNLTTNLTASYIARLTTDLKGTDFSKSEIEKRLNEAEFTLTQWKNPVGSTINLAFYKGDGERMGLERMDHLKFGYYYEIDYIEKNLCEQIKFINYFEAKRYDDRLSWGGEISEAESMYTCVTKDSEFTVNWILSIIESKDHIYHVEIKALKEYFDKDKSAYYELIDSIKDRGIDDTKIATYISMRWADSVYEDGEVKFTVKRYEKLEVLNKETCWGGRGQCWRVQHMETGESGYVSVDRMRKVHHIYSAEAK